MCARACVFKKLKTESQPDGVVLLYAQRVLCHAQHLRNVQTRRPEGANVTTTSTPPPVPPSITTTLKKVPSGARWRWRGHAPAGGRITPSESPPAVAQTPQPSFPPATRHNRGSPPLCADLAVLHIYIYLPRVLYNSRAVARVHGGAHRSFLQKKGTNLTR